MRITVKYEDGHLVPQGAIRFRGQTFEIEVPDAEVADAPPLSVGVIKAVENEGAASYTLPAEAKEYSEQVRSELDAIRDALLSTHDELPGFTEKQGERLKAFSPRAEMRKGRES